jgi:hypothetical protein
MGLRRLAPGLKVVDPATRADVDNSTALTLDADLPFLPLSRCQHSHQSVKQR